MSKEELEEKLKEAKTVEEKLKIMIETDETILKELKEQGEMLEEQGKRLEEQRKRLEALSFQTKTIKELWGLSVAEKAIAAPTNPGNK
ncbi:MAG: hypothetical protein HY929_06020 [Euryarchaeota archaeon]|nr:hypothetical protein [Euryarchaeota archaeon]